MKNNLFGEIKFMTLRKKNSLFCEKKFDLICFDKIKQKIKMTSIRTRKVYEDYYKKINLVEADYLWENGK